MPNETCTIIYVVARNILKFSPSPTLENYIELLGLINNEILSHLIVEYNLVVVFIIPIEAA